MRPWRCSSRLATDAAALIVSINAASSFFSTRNTQKITQSDRATTTTIVPRRERKIGKKFLLAFGLVIYDTIPARLLINFVAANGEAEEDAVQALERPAPGSQRVWCRSSGARREK
jgi:hypothetical protein